MVSYADFVTLLFAFFTTLYAISKVDSAKLSFMVQSVHEAFEPPSGNGLLAGGKSVLDGHPPTAPKTQPDAQDIAVAAQLEKRLASDLAGGRVALQIDGRGVVISMLETGAFPVGSAELTPVAREVLSRIATTVHDVNSAIRVEGHTDDVPIHTARFASNWELSTARATSVVQYLIDAAHMPAWKLSASGYGEFHPGVVNDSPANRARNRRVDVVILNPGTRASEEPPAPPSLSEMSGDSRSR
jgi:chemotaxis protein MotB